MQTVAQRIIAALGPETGLPVAQGTYRGEADTYFVFNMDAIPEDFADDMPEHERY